MRGSVIGLVVVLMLVGAGCFYPAQQHPLPPATDQVVLDLPYDLAWDAVNSVIAANDFKVSARDPNSGVIEAQSHKFTLKDADCGKIKGIAGISNAEPNADASAVYNFYVKATGTKTSLVSVTATYTAPLVAPFHPPQSMQCVSTGQAEAHLLEQVTAQAAVTHRPGFTEPGQLPTVGSTQISGPGSIMNRAAGIGSPQGETPAGLAPMPSFGGSAAPSSIEASPAAGAAVGTFGAGASGDEQESAPEGSSPAPTEGTALPLGTAPAEGAPALGTIPNLKALGTSAGGMGGGTHLLPMPSFGSPPLANPGLAPAP